LIDMGRVAGAYGVRGWVKVAPGGGVSQSLALASQWWIAEQCYEVSAAKLHGASVVAQLAGVDSREQAMQLKGARVAVERAALGEAGAGHYFLADLLGVEVLNEQGERLGHIERWLSNGAQDVMQLAGGRLIPWVGAIVKEVDLEAKRIVVDWGADW
jgi:16S rRNA processing protein RimM